MELLSIKSILMMTPILLIALPVHEFAHGWVAYRMGDPTAKYAGRLTLNPFKHLDLMGVLMMYLAGVGWAKPVPVNSSYFRDRRKGIILVSMAGPLSNILASFITFFLWGILLKLISIGTIPIESDKAVYIVETIIEFFQTLIIVNISLAVFNLIPVPPLDGSRLISAFIPEESYYRFARYEQYIGLAFLLLVVVLPSNLFSEFIYFFANPIFNSMARVVQLVLRL